jgi:hypothetical protein
LELTMTKQDDQDQALREEHERYLRTTFGDDVFVGLATDLPVTTNRPSSAQVHVQERDQALADLHREDREARLTTATALAQDQAAYDRVVAGSTDDQDRHAADRHVRRHGLVPRRSSVDRLIAQGERARRSS